MAYYYSSYLLVWQVAGYLSAPPKQRDERDDDRDEDRDQHDPAGVPGVEEDRARRAKRDDADPHVDQQNRAPLRVADLQQSVVQMHLVRAERTASGAGTPHETCEIGPAAVVDAAASISPISIEPESPMKMRAGSKLCGKKPRHAPASTTEITAGG